MKPPMSNPPLEESKIEEIILDLAWNISEIPFDYLKENFNNSKLGEATQAISKLLIKARIDELEKLLGYQWVRSVQGTAQLNPPQEKLIVYVEDIENRIAELQKELSK